MRLRLIKELNNIIKIHLNIEVKFKKNDDNLIKKLFNNKNTREEKKKIISKLIIDISDNNLDTILNDLENKINSLNEINKKKIKDNIKEISLNYDHFGKKKDFNSIIEFLSKNIYNKENVYTEFLNNILEELDDKEIGLEDIENINKKLYNFINYNKKKYLNKIKNDNWVIYEYEEHYEWWVNNNNFDIDKERAKLFGSNEILSIKIDNTIWKNVNNVKKVDIAKGKKILYVIKKGIFHMI